MGARTTLKNLKSKKRASRDEAIDTEVDAEEEAIGAAGGLNALGSGLKPHEETIPLDPSAQGGSSGYAPPAEGSSGYGVKFDLRHDEEEDEENDEAPPVPSRSSEDSAPMDPSVANAMKDLISGEAFEDPPKVQQDQPASSSELTKQPAPVLESESQDQQTFKTVDSASASSDRGINSVISDSAAVSQGQWGNKIIPGVTVPIGYKTPEQETVDGKIKDNEEEGEFGEGHTSVFNTFVMFCVIAIVYYSLYYVYLNIGARD